MKRLIQNTLMRIFPELFGLKGRVRVIEHNVITGQTIVHPWKDNLIVTAGKVMALRRLGGIGLYANEGQITYGAVGTGNTTLPDAADTAMETELDRAPISYQQVVGTILTLRVFFSTSQANGTLKEFAWFGEAATAAAGSGTMFNRINIDYTKTSAVTYTIEQEISIA